MKRRLGLGTAIVAVLAIGGIVAWRGLARLVVPGATLVLAVDSAHPYDERTTPDAARRATLAVLHARLSKLAPLALMVADGDRVEVQLARGDAPETMARLLTRSARLDFELVDDGSDYMRQVASFADGHRADIDVEVGVDHWLEAASGAPHDDVYLHARDRAALAKAWRAITAPLPMPSGHTVAFEHKPDQWRSYFLMSTAEVTGDRITDAEVSSSPQSERAELALTFDAEGARAFAGLTARALGRKLAIVLDGVVQTAPVVESKIGGGHARITFADGTNPAELQRSAKELVALLRIGSLDAPVTLLEIRAPARDR